MSCSDLAPFARQRALIELPGRDDDFLLRRDEIVERGGDRRQPSPPWLCASANSCSYGLTSRKKMSLRASFDRVPRVRVMRARA